MKPRTVISAVFLALVVAFTVANYRHWLTLQHMLVERGWNALPEAPGGPELIETVREGGPASALRVGDEVVAVNGRNVERSDYKTENAFRPVRSGDTYTLAVRRDGRAQDFTLRREPVPFLGWLLSSGLYIPVLTSAVYFLIGLLVFALKPEDKQAVLLAICLSLLASSFSLPQPFEGQAWWFAALMAFGFVTKQLFAALLLHLFLVFPEPSPLLRRRPRLELYMYLPAVPVLALSSYVMWLWALAPEEFFAFSLRYRWLSSAISLTQLAYAACALAAFALSYRRAGQVARRKLRIVLFGCVLTFVPLFIRVVMILTSRETAGTAATRWGVVSLLSLSLPVAFAYAIVRHQVIPVRLIIRRGLQYLLAKNALRLAMALPVVGLAASVAADPHRTLSEILFRNSLYFYLLLALAAALGLVFRRRLGEWVDRKFFRETYNQEKILRELVEDVKKLDSIPEMSKRVTERVTAALHPEQAYLFYRAEGERDLSLSYTSGGAPQVLKIPEEFRLLRFMEDQGSAQEFPFPQKNNLPRNEKAWLANLGTRLIVPLTGTDARLSGLLLLGGKKSEVPYTAGDRDLLETLAGQIAIVYENVRLKSRVDRDRRLKHEVLSRVAGQNMNLLKECPRCGSCFDMTTLHCERDGAELTLSLPVERTIEGRYRLDKLLGKGGMGAVYEATDLRLHRRVAVKILTGSMFGNSEALRRFEREAQASARLHHPNIVTIHDYGLLSTEGAFLVMELITGETLGARLRRERRLAPPAAAHVFDQLLDGLKSAHAAGVVHRDLKPENLLLSVCDEGQTRVHILDFGLAKLTQSVGADSRSPTAAPVTTPGAVMGTFGYMPPEQLTGGEVDARSDIFSVGVMVAEAVTGRRPFTGATYHELLTNILQGSFQLPAVGPGAERLDAALRKCLAKEPARRYASAADAQAELIPALRECPPLDEQAADIFDAETHILNQ